MKRERLSVVGCGERKSPLLRLWPAILLSFTAGALVSAWIGGGSPAAADNGRVFELMIYHTVPGKVPELESIFRDVSKLQAKYGLDVLGYWMPDQNPAWNDTFVYLVAHPSLQDAKKNWRALHADPAFLPYRTAAEPLIQRVDNEFRVEEIYMRAAAFSALR